MRFFLLLTLLFLSPLSAFAETASDLLMGAVVKSNKWKMSRKDNTETFIGNVSFKNDIYNLNSDKAVYFHKDKKWNINGNVYMKRQFDNNSYVEMFCDKADYYQLTEQTNLWRGVNQIKMAYTGQDGVINGYTDKVSADNRLGIIIFNGKFSLSTENISLYSAQGNYSRLSDNFILTDTPKPTEGDPMSVGNREGYNFAIRSKKIYFFKTSRDVVFHKKISGWVKDIPYLENLKKDKK